MELHSQAFNYCLNYMIYTRIEDEGGQEPWFISVFPTVVTVLGTKKTVSIDSMNE